MSMVKFYEWWKCRKSQYFIKAKWKEVTMHQLHQIWGASNDMYPVSRLLVKTKISLVPDFQNSKKNAWKFPIHHIWYKIYVCE